MPEGGEIWIKKSISDDALSLAKKSAYWLLSPESVLKSNVLREQLLGKRIWCCIIAHRYPGPDKKVSLVCME
ncbi:hypothetical protein L195_g039220 [Trifolium pratense]|uniref:Uncharacterized protein n=1 Tax=Trifolium pratense TaxID=57577 RepID=A0A2K3LXB5_TRIPR|nr:hypothetical protein L195_g039220 [Trifolium pratense]